MGISLLTALTIQGNESDVAAGTGENGKYGFEIYSIIRERDRHHLTSQPIYDTEDIAMKEGKKLLDSIKSLDLKKDKRELSDAIGNDTLKIVNKISSVAKGKSD